ncbi:MAG: hypothetical protein HZC49_13565 [Nitrospirae bacterium]|nr:hypothetical protein [Nitrospirota bacterium]
MPATIKMDIDQVKGLISQFSIKEKEDLARYLDSLTLKNRFKKLLSAKKNIPISYKEITKEVEKVRIARYK